MRTMLFFLGLALVAVMPIAKVNAIKCFDNVYYDAPIARCDYADHNACYIDVRDPGNMRRTCQPDSSLFHCKEEGIFCCKEALCNESVETAKSNGPYRPVDESVKTTTGNGATPPVPLLIAVIASAIAAFGI